MYMYLIVYINVMYAFMYVCMVCMMYVRMYVSIYLYLYLYIYISMQFTLLHIHIKCWKDMELTKPSFAKCFAKDTNYLSSIK